ncbi:hypothetical protein HDE_09160 [Halotydeus destructor]|nr:hypothetical protein HDE_09160 [Halotydeus destructor]
MLEKLVFLALVGFAMATPQCLSDGGANKTVCTLSQWRRNIQCRITGKDPEASSSSNSTSGSTASSASSGYLSYTTVAASDTAYIMAVKQQTATVMARILSQIRDRYSKVPDATKTALLLNHEKALNTAMPKLMGIGWQQSSTPCGLTTRSVANCGDVGTPYTPPSCEIPATSASG